jgi:hypothetical protein
MKWRFNMNVLETYLAKTAGEYDGDLPGADSRLAELLEKIEAFESTTA